MPQMTKAIASIQSALEKVKLPELTDRAGIPYTTAVEWRAKQWRPNTIAAFEKLANAAEAVNSEHDERPDRP